MNEPEAPKGTLALLALYFVVLKEPVEMPVAEPLDPTPVPAWLDSWRGWLYGAVALVLLGYGPILYVLIRDAQLWSPGFKPW